MAEEQQPPPAQATVAGTLLGYLTSITTWYRASIAIALGLTSLFGLLVYQHPQTLFDLAQGLLTRRHEHAVEPYMTPLTTDVEREMKQLLPQLGPHAVAVTAWRVHLAANQAELAGAAVNPNLQATFDQYYAERWRYPVAVFGDDADVNNALGRLYIGRFHCTKELGGWRAARRFPLRELCMIALPPEGYGLAGVIIAGWDDEVAWDQLASIESGMRDVAARLTWWPQKQADAVLGH